MTTFVALLRGINVGGKNPIKMEALRSLFATLGYEGVTTYIQSGNVVFTSSTRATGKVADTIKRGVAQEFGFDVTILVRTADELAAIVAANPLQRRNADPSKLHVMFLASAPSAAKVRSLDASLGAPDEFAVVGREVFLHCPSGYGRTKLTGTFFEKQFGVDASTRNWKTVQTLVELADTKGAA